jgi:uncharacterized protein YeaO (DUF488 family)
MGVRIKRAYDPPEPSDGYRVLIDRFWPRGITRGNAHLDEWAHELAPSSELRRWFAHDPELFEEFRVRYARELAAHDGNVEALRRRAREGTVTLIYAARDAEHNDAVVLANILSNPPRREEKKRRAHDASVRRAVGS